MMNVQKHGGYCSSEILCNPQLSHVLQTQISLEDVGCFLLFKQENPPEKGVHIVLFE